MKTRFILLCLALLVISTFADATTQSETPKSDVTQTKGNLFSAFAQSFSSIVVSELGDKTFFIAAIMAMRYNRLAVLCGALLALFLMTGISTAFGSIVPSLLPASVTHVLITILFFFFGGKLLYDAYSDDGEESNEQAEVEIELNQMHSKLLKSSGSATHDVQVNEITYEKPVSTKKDVERSPTKKDCASHIEHVASKLVFWQALTLTFLGEWGDRSQISTIALAAETSAYFVFVGAFMGHVLCTTLAVMGGKFLAKKISERTVNMCGGLLFLLFGIHNLFMKGE